MLKEIAEILKRSSENIAGLPWVGGFVLVFLSFFGFKDFKSITVYATPSLWPLFAGIALIVAAFLLRIMEKRKLGSTGKPGDQLSDRLVFLLRHYDSLGKSNFEFPEHFAQAVFEYDHPDERLSDADRQAWVKVSDYAARYDFARRVGQ